MARPRGVQGNAIAEVAEEIRDAHVITKECKVCGKDQPVKGVTWEDIESATGFSVPTGTKRQPIQALCATCAYKASRVGVELTPEQKKKRAESQKKRQAEIAEALKLLRSQRNAALDEIIDADA